MEWILRQKKINEKLKKKKPEIVKKEANPDEITK